MSNFMDWGSHLPLLAKLLPLTTGDVLELGMGWYSTPLLHWACMDQGRRLVSYENDKAYYDMFRDVANEYHEINFISDWAQANILREWGLAFVDFRPKNQRRKAVRVLANLARVIVIHDTDAVHEKHYRYSTIYSLFKYRYDYVKFTPHTAALSNFYDLEDLHG